MNWKLLQLIIKKHGYLIILAAVLYILSFILNDKLSSDLAPKNAVKKIEQKVQNSLQVLEKAANNTTLLLQITSGINNESISYTNTNAGIYLYALNDIGNPILSYWNTNKFTLSISDITKQDGIYFNTYTFGSCVLYKKTIVIQNSPYFFVGIVPIQWQFFIENKYLQTHFDGLEALKDGYAIATTTTKWPVKTKDKKPLFYLETKKISKANGYNWFTLLLRIFSIACLVIFINRCAIQLIYHIGFTKSFFFFIIVVLFFRILSYATNFPFNYDRMPLFDASIYASNFIHPSLGHLFVNVCMFFWIVSFYKFNFPVKTWQPKPVKFLQPIVNIAFLFVILYLIIGIIKSLVVDSKISFQVTEFFTLNKYSVICFAILALLALCFYHIAYLLLYKFFTNTQALQKILFITILIGLIASSVLLIFGESIEMMLQTLWLFVLVCLLYTRKQDAFKPMANTPVFIFWAMFFAISMAWIISYNNDIKIAQQKAKIAERILLDEDVKNENLLGIATANMDEAFLSNNKTRLFNKKENNAIKDSIIKEDFAPLFNKFETNIYTFSAGYLPLFNDDSSITYQQLKNITTKKSKQTSTKGLFATQVATNKIVYVFEQPILSRKDTVGYFFIVAKNELFKKDAVYPSLFSQASEFSTENELHLSYAVYKNSKLFKKYGYQSFSFSINPKHFPPYQYTTIKNKVVNQLWYNDGLSKVIVIMQPNNKFIEWVTLLAYLFFTLLMVVGLFHVLQFLVTLQYNKAKSWFQPTIRLQIHATVLFISVFSFVIIGASTIQFFKNKFTNSTQQRLAKTIDIIANEVNADLKEVQLKKMFDEANPLSNLNVNSSFEQRIVEIAQLHNIDINLYSKEGNLLASSQPFIYTKQLLNTKMQTKAFFKLNTLNETLVIENEEVGGLEFLSVYIPMLDDGGSVYAYLNIPYLNTQIELNQEISSFLATLINLNAFVFLIAGAIAFLITEKVIRSFSLITSKMQAIQVTEINAPIVWNRKDEIGSLVEEYNKMVQQLNLSIQALKLSEREGAWREMARQVAHEIKNPLTPMKLSIQYLQQAIKNNQPNAKELSERVSNTLIEQINQLTNIANDFSQFANIGSAKPEKINLQEVLKSVIQLHEQSATISATLIDKSVLIFADTLQINRLFTNLIKNSIEAFDEHAVGQISIVQTIENNSIITIIKDNGSGIPDEMRDKMFSPNFTTKTSGTGLGLAICKGIVDKFGGTISFTTEKNVGTIFSICFPLA